ncbi:MAG: hypothetical protein IJ088_14505 [Clostridia bacterium]|nr:hypothetical protein [Clostridia bacterium]
MKTDVVLVSSNGVGMDEALGLAERVGQYKQLPPKAVLQLRLLSEELMGMMRSITGEKSGQFWIEDEDGTYMLHLLVDTRMNTVKREQLLTASTSGKNESARGFMGHLRDFFDRNADQDVVAFTNSVMNSGIHDSPQDILYDVEWSMVKYRQDLYSNKDSSEDRAAAWDELEKSVVSHVADEVKVFIHNQQAEMVIYKKFA